MIVGVDIGGTSTKIGLVQKNKVIAMVKIPTKDNKHTGRSFADLITRTIVDLSTKYCYSISSVGIGAPNGNAFTGCIDPAPNLPWKKQIPLANMLSKRLKVPCILGNDANAAALGEWYYGAGKGCTDLLVVTLGTGLGSGFIVGGNPLLGPYSTAGELGHTTLVIDGRMCSCGKSGCLEAYVSIRGIRQTYSELTNNRKPLNEQGVLPIVESAKIDDPFAHRTFDKTANWLAIGLANAVAITAPQKIILCGGIAQSGDLLMLPLKNHFKKTLFSTFKNKVELSLSSLPPDAAGILGAAALTLHK